MVMPVESCFEAFEVKELQEGCISSLIGVCQAWSKVSQSIAMGNISFSERIQLENCDRVCFHIEKQIHKELILKQSGLKKARKCMGLLTLDAAKNIQAIAITELYEKSLEIKYIVTNPENLVFSASSLSKPVKGSGGVLVKYLKAKAVLQNISMITVQAFKDAVGFYRKLGFSLRVEGLSDDSVLMMNWCNEDLLL